jgi:hypothetical protein
LSFFTAGSARPRFARSEAHHQEVTLRSSVLLSGSIIAAVSLTTLSSRADTEYPLSFVERPLTLPAMTLAPEFDIGVERAGLGSGLGAVSATAGVMNLGATFGITNDIEVGALVVPIQFNDPAGYGDPEFFATFRFLHTPSIELGARLNLVIATPRDGLSAGALIMPGVPLLVHVGKILRIDAEVAVPISVQAGTGISTSGGPEITTTNAVGVGLTVPVEVAVDIIEPLHADVTTGLTIGDFRDAADSTVVPLGFGVGYAIGTKRPLLDLDLAFNWPLFAVPGSPDSKVNAGFFTLGLTAKGYFYF